MKIIINMLANIFGLKHEIDNKLYRKEIYRYFRWKQWKYKTSITYVKAFKNNNKIIIEIELHRPGLLIGKAGCFINGLEKYLINETKQNIKINIKECNIWNDLYN